MAASSSVGVGSALLLSGSGWAVVRLVGIKLRATLPAGEGEQDRITFPSIRTLNGWQILLGRSRKTGLGYYTTMVDDSWFESVRNNTSPVHGLTYVILSELEVVLFLVGPLEPAAAAPEGIDNIEVQWPGRSLSLVGPGSAFFPLRRIREESKDDERKDDERKDDERKDDERKDDERKDDDDPQKKQCYRSFVPTTDQRQIPINYKGPFGCLEVQTRIWNSSRSVFMRLEQFSPQRIPLAEYTVWRESSHGAYSSWLRRAATLQKLSSASYCWMFSVREIFEDSGWAAAFHQRGPGDYLAVLGFETNNPIHDDHDGRGAHFHLGIKSEDKRKDRNPAFYISPEDGSVRLAVSYSGAASDGGGGGPIELTASGMFGVFRLFGGQLGLGPLVRLQNVRTGMYLYVRESEQGPGQGIFQTQDGDMLEHVSWLLLSASQTSDARLLCNVKSSCFAHVDSQHLAVVDPLCQSSDGKSPGSQWSLQVSASHPGRWHLVNATSGLYMYGFFAQQALPVAQFDQADDGSEWILQYRDGGGDGRDASWLTASSFHDLPPCYTVNFASSSELAAAADISKNGSAWSHVSLQRRFVDDRIGFVDVEVRFADPLLSPRLYAIKFDRLTGKQL